MMTGRVVSELESLKASLGTIRMAHDYDRFARFFESGAREWYERLNLASGGRLLDVGCGSGQLALMAEKDGLEVTGSNIASNSVERAGRARRRKVCRLDSKKPMQRHFLLRLRPSMWW